MVAIPPLSSAIANAATPLSAPIEEQPSTPAPVPASKASDKVIHDSMEEVSAAFGEQMERKSKSLNRRQISQMQNRMEANIERIEKLTELFHLLENPKQPTLDQQVRRMQGLMLQTPPASVEALVQAAGGDAARSDIVLRHLLAQAREQRDPALEQAARASLARIQQEKGPEVRAGLNTAAAISLFSTDPQQKQILRELYYERIVHQQSPSSLLDALLERFDAQHFTAGLRTLQRALAADIASLASSISKTALSQMLKHLNDARQLSHTLSSSQQLLEHGAHRFPAATLGAVELTRRLIGLSANGAYIRDLHNLGREVAGQHAQRQLLFFNALLRLVGDLPQTLWRDSKHRHTALHLIRGLIGDLSRQEAAELAAAPRKE
ncbi:MULTISPECIES: type III secretion system gatekeeper subunit SctW [Lonsdalea]|uniref:SepL/TyeA/HrpJ family type III secretion system gatekeeper n=2 Tax=Lonsdalea TaxID=1082702 RepID=A0ACD1JFY8_9GAMM|nr:MULTISPECIES: type III secretion system gatekeeper subunit SctW [Lonsdalea]OSN02638.1 SepL/TyeA/HrpJ family type III secretion system gatekeeper [Lonsdalea populi]QPQ25604.1 type III secretion system gatekeeper subunit SctW [Lonsdalea populi]RAT16114.1 SepL/TyeA/HrpJ family type III secretion system gatekeeper [Lonsdalea quercina]RAT21285.1 SepL/TyeA/HrpJ family type III secretion system gatekeeper [Lonsdalea populi]RAT22229.1 SepL/TyeA/HrpJ family type III secretion system gatekeeper [Lons